MREKKVIVINTSPIIALAAGVGDLSFLSHLYSKVIVSQEVFQELQADAAKSLGLNEALECPVIEIAPAPVQISSYLLNSLDIGEASVIQTALNLNIDTVCIDEVSGRRQARLHQKKLTGSLGICLRAVKEGVLAKPMPAIIEDMQKHGIYLSRELIQQILPSI